MFIYNKDTGEYTHKFSLKENVLVYTQSIAQGIIVTAITVSIAVWFGNRYVIEKKPIRKALTVRAVYHTDSTSVYCLDGGTIDCIEIPGRNTFSVGDTIYDIER